MVRTLEVEVLVVGAGPVGLFTALVLAEHGIKVQLIDQQWRTAAHSYACALHPATLKLLDQFGLAAEVVKRGRRVERIAFYEGATRQAEVKLADFGGDFPFLLVVPQSEFEELLEQRLLRNHQLQVLWNHRLSRLQFQADRAVAHIEKLGENSTGYIIAHLERVVEKSLQTNAGFVIGADGLDSPVRHALGIPYDTSGNPELFEVFELQTSGPTEDELRVVLHGDTTSALWPLPGNRCRWSLQKIPAHATGEPRAKDRLAVRFADDMEDPDKLLYLRQLIRERAPWFKAGFTELDWSIEVQFAHRLARAFGRDRACLAGDAAHQTGPVGMQSMNLGLQEAAGFAGIMHQILRQNASLELLGDYAQARQREWEGLLKDGWRAREPAASWIRANAGKIPSCLPAAGQTLIRMASQLGLEPAA